MNITEEMTMPILYANRDERRFRNGFPASVTLPVSCEWQAGINHNQSLRRLAERGGVSLEEAVALIEGREWKRMDVFELVDAFRKYHWVNR